MRKTKIGAAVGLTAAAAMSASLLATPAHAHGSMGDPVSRVYNCYLEGPESPQTQGCIDFVNENGTQGLYDWHEVNIPNAAGNHEDIIPDGQLCSAGRDKYSGLDNMDTEWVSTQMSSGQQTLEYAVPVQHAGYFEIYVTQEGWSPSSGLNWGDLEEIGYVENPSVVDGSYQLDVNIPDRSGEHMIYSVWQRTDSPEAFYTCSDVTF